MTTDNFCFYLQNRHIQTSQTGGQWYSDTPPFSIPWIDTGEGEREKERKRLQFTRVDFEEIVERNICHFAVGARLLQFFVALGKMV